jgi:CheY-like chemotaxis protein
VLAGNTTTTQLPMDARQEEAVTKSGVQVIHQATESSGPYRCPSLLRRGRKSYMRPSERRRRSAGPAADPAYATQLTSRVSLTSAAAIFRVVGSMLRSQLPVLVVEDHERTQEAIERLLHLRGYTVVKAASGHDALAYLRGGGSACLIVLDAVMPEMDGWAFREYQLADPALAHIPVVVFSGDTRATPMPGAGFVRKTDPDGLLNFVDRHALMGG